MKKLYRNDLVLCCAVVLLCVALPFIWRMGQKGALQLCAVVSLDGNEEKRVPLDGDESFVINGVTVVVKDGCAYVSQSTCPDSVCVKTGKAQEIGDSIVCVPNRVSVKIMGQRNEGGEDVVAG